MAAIHNLEFVGHILQRPLSIVDGLYCCAIFCWNHYNSCDNTVFWILSTSGLKTPIHAPFWVFWG